MPAGDLFKYRIIQSGRAQKPFGLIACWADVGQCSFRAVPQINRSHCGRITVNLKSLPCAKGGGAPKACRRDWFDNYYRFKELQSSGEQSLSHSSTNDNSLYIREPFMFHDVFAFCGAPFIR